MRLDANSIYLEFDPGLLPPYTLSLGMRLAAGDPYLQIKEQVLDVTYLTLRRWGFDAALLDTRRCWVLWWRMAGYSGRCWLSWQVGRCASAS